MKLENYLWTHAIDLVFDCYYASNLSPIRQGHCMYARIKKAAANLAQHLRGGLHKGVKPDVYWLQLAELMVGELKQHLVIAKSLGFLGERAFYKLHTRAVKLAGVMAHPKVKRQFKVHS